jgi:hypothetical protein
MKRAGGYAVGPDVLILLMSAAQTLVLRCLTRSVVDRGGTRGDVKKAPKRPQMASRGLF